MKKLIVFDLDGTLAESKASLDAEMSKLLSALLRIVKVAVISGGDWPQFEKQVLSNLPHDEHLKNLSLLCVHVLRFVLKERDCSLHPPGESSPAPDKTHRLCPRRRAAEHQQLSDGGRKDVAPAGAMLRGATVS